MDELQRIAERWVENFSVDPYVVRERQMDVWHSLDSFVYNDVVKALVVFELVSAQELTDWTFEGFAAGPVRTFLSLYGDRYDPQLTALCRRSATFEQIWDLAAEGL